MRKALKHSKRESEYRRRQNGTEVRDGIGGGGVLVSRK